MTTFSSSKWLLDTPTISAVSSSVRGRCEIKILGGGIDCPFPIVVHRPSPSWRSLLRRIRYPNLHIRWPAIRPRIIRDEREHYGSSRPFFLILKRPIQRLIAERVIYHGPFVPQRHDAIQQIGTELAHESLASIHQQ